jgi:hypothetical protein
MYYRIPFMKFIGFLSTYQTVPKSNHSGKKLLITERRNMETVAKPTLSTWF